MKKTIKSIILGIVLWVVLFEVGVLLMAGLNYTPLPEGIWGLLFSMAVISLLIAINTHTEDH